MFGGIKLETAHVLVGVAGVTVVGEERTDAHFEELFVGGLRKGGSAGSEQRGESDEWAWAHECFPKLWL